MEEAVDRALLARRDTRMREAAAALSPPAFPTAADLPPVRFLTGERFAHQTAFCARSLCITAGFVPTIQFFDDGSLLPEQAERLGNLFPGSSIIPATESFAALERHLPASRFPSLRFAREHSPLMRKLLDMRAGRAGPSLYLDSDMLFFAPPSELIAWLRSPHGELFMNETGPGAYVDAPETLARELGRNLPPGVNTGILALDDSDLDWAALEHTAASLGKNRLVHKWAEQTLFAWFFTRPSAHALDPSAYRVCQSRTALTGPLPTMRHYVYKSKMPYLAGEWRHMNP
jgi:hypothetical protein